MSLSRDLFAGFAAGAVACAPALGQGLYGSTVTATLDFPTLGNVVAGPLVAEAGPGVEFAAEAFLPGRMFSIDIEPTQIRYLPGETTSYGVASFNGFSLAFAGAPAIVAITVDAASTFAPVSFSWDAGSLAFNLAGLAVAPSDQLVFNVSVVPEARSLALMLLGMAALAPVVARRRQASRMRAAAA